jgi:hypothetical protein
MDEVVVPSLSTKVRFSNSNDAPEAVVTEQYRNMKRIHDKHIFKAGLFKALFILCCDSMMILNIAFCAVINYAKTNYLF